MRTRRTPLAALAIACLSAGCGGEVRPNDDLTVIGDNGRVGAIEVLNVYVEAPEGDRHSPGEDIVVRFTMVNGGDQPDELVGAEVPGAGQTTVHWDSECDGTAQAVESIPLPPGTTGIDVGPPEERRHQPYYATATDLAEQVVAGTTLPMSFTFAEAGTVRVDALVAADKPRPVQADYACSVESPDN